MWTPHIPDGGLSMRHWLWGVLAAVVAAAGCSGTATNAPTAPSATTAPGPAAGKATIAGHVTLTGSPSSTARAFSALAGSPATVGALPSMTASVVGTSLSAPVSSSGAFVIEGVPEGVVRLRFVATGIDAAVTLDPVAPTDAISVLIGLSPTGASVEAESRNAGGFVEFEGRIESLPPTQPADTLLVGGRTITVSPHTEIRDGGTTIPLTALSIGQRVHVRGRLDGASIAAVSIDLQNTNTWIPVVINGVVESMSGTSSAFTFVVDGREIRGDQTTAFFGSGDQALPFSALVADAQVNVKGQQRDAWVFAERIHVASPTMTPEPQDTSASIEGRLNTIGGTAPQLTLTVGTTTVTTTSTTDVQRGGDVQPLGALAIGQTIHAVGTRLADGSIVARKLQIKGDEPGGAVQMAGAVGGLKGTCPTLTFGVNGYTVVTSAVTSFGPGTNACAALKSGSKVEVEGTRQADGTVKADTVTGK